MDEHVNVPVDEQAETTAEQSGVAPELMDYLQHHIASAEMSVRGYTNPTRKLTSELMDAMLEGRRVDDPRLAPAQARLAQLQTAREAAVQGDYSGMAAELERDYQTNAANLESMRQYIVAHPIGSLKDDDLYMEKKTEALRLEKELKSKDEDPAGLKQLTEDEEDRAIQGLTERGRIMYNVSVYYRQKQHLEALCQLLPQPPSTSQ